MASASDPIPRLLAPRVREALADTPVVLIHGPRQSGKTTLARLVGEKRGYRYYSFDEDAVRAAAERDPVGFVAELPAHAILDEVQRVPALFTAIKASVDRRRVAGRCPGISPTPPGCPASGPSQHRQPLRPLITTA